MKQTWKIFALDLNIHELVLFLN